MLYEKAEKIDMKLVLSIGAGCLAGVMAYVSVSYGFSAMSTKGVVFCISFAVGALLVWIHNKRPKAKWLSDYLMTISMLGVACDGGDYFARNSSRISPSLLYDQLLCFLSNTKYDFSPSGSVIS